MLAGEVQRRRERIAIQQAELEQFAQKIAALDSAIALSDERVNPQALGAVKATAERYEGWGGLSRFLESEICAAGETGIDTVELAIRAACRFSIPIESTKDLSRYRDTVTWALRALRKNGRIENIYVSGGGHKPSTWRSATGSGAFEALIRQRVVIEGDKNG